MTYIRSNFPPTGLEDLRVLLVDDNELTRRMMERVLRAFGITQICHASDGEEALETARLYFRPNVIITDWDMKPMNGLTFVSELRMTQPSSVNIPVVMVSARTGESAI
ncbi:MAG: response regulator, partial [Rhodospirillales bacterium]|nr:response regulator [Rhodospirillales bacterium]